MAAGTIVVTRRHFMAASFTEADSTAVADSTAAVDFMAVADGGN
jgi:hypothetical protein